jgi:hypothetical protein
LNDSWANITAKNYSKLRNISLLGAGSMMGLISQWATNQETKNYYYTSLGYGTEQYFKEANTLIGA